MLTLEHIGARFGTVTVLDDVSFDVAAGEILCLLGPSGSGKSTLLRLVAGIDRPTSGRIAIDSRAVADSALFVEPEQRRVGMVFQDYALFPHLTVAANVAFGAPAAGPVIPALLRRLGIERLATSYPHQLSGGERQRVALARAMAPQPRILLMDEPFSSLDSRLREDVRRHTLDFLREAGTTTVIVTHDPGEALRIADRIVLLEAGRIVQIGTPAELYGAPRTLFAARFFSDIAAVTGTLRDGVLETRLGRFPAARVAAGEPAIACLRPEHVELATEATPIAGRVIGSQYCGEGRELLVAIDGVAAPVVVRAPSLDERGTQWPTGTVVHVAVRSREVPVVTAG